jgi:hypothetical protein
MKVLPYSPKSSKLRGEFSIEFKKDCTLYFAASTVFVKKGSKVVVVERERLGK